MGETNGQKVVLFIDDDNGFLEVMQEAIQHPNFSVQTYQVSNGYQTIDEIIKRKPHVLFIDFCLPNISGSQILSILKSVQGLAHLSIYLVTGYSKEAVKPFLIDFDLERVLIKDESFRTEVLRILDQIDSAA